jgi:phospho-N-acetylmuramoyl-pentapeptide-transferase
MLYKILYGMHTVFTPFNVFRYITFRTALAVITAMVISLIIGPWLIDWLRKISFTQQIRDDGPQTHLKKSGTPTMGGIIIIICILVSVFMWGDLENMYIWMMVLSLIGFGGIGLLDDYLKVVRKNPKGLHSCYKFGSQIVLAL